MGKRHLEPAQAARYTKVRTSLALLAATYEKFLGRLEVPEALEWPPFAEWLAEQAHELAREQGVAGV